MLLAGKFVKTFLVEPATMDSGIGIFTIIASYEALCSLIGLTEKKVHCTTGGLAWEYLTLIKSTVCTCPRGYR